jgi:hypothetical protein
MIAADDSVSLCVFGLDDEAIAHERGRPRVARFATTAGGFSISTAILATMFAPDTCPGILGPLEQGGTSVFLPQY